MAQSDTLQINLDEQFPHLSKAPITEAVIQVSGRASALWNEDEVAASLQKTLPGYPTHESPQGFLSQIQFAAGKEPSVTAKALGSKGVLFTSADGKHKAHFNVDFFALSRLQPYDTWDSFSGEAMRLWNIHHKLLCQTEVQRLGVRFINRVPVTTAGFPVGEYFEGFPVAVTGLSLELTGFLHHDIVSIPGHLYMVNIIKTAQPAVTPDQSAALILDIDVFTQQPFEPEESVLRKKLTEIHWLENKIFFSIITPTLLNQLK